MWFPAQRRSGLPTRSMNVSSHETRDGRRVRRGRDDSYSKFRQSPNPTLKTWYFAEGSTAPGLPFEEEILIGNPTGTDAVVNLRFFPQDGSAPIPGQLTVKPYSRGGVNARQFTGANSGSPSKSRPRVPTSWSSAPCTGAAGSSISARSTTPARSATCAPATAAPASTRPRRPGRSLKDRPGFFQTYVLVSNPGDAGRQRAGQLPDERGRAGHGQRRRAVGPAPHVLRQRSADPAARARGSSSISPSK